MVKATDRRKPFPVIDEPHRQNHRQTEARPGASWEPRRGTALLTAAATTSAARRALRPRPGPDSSPSSRVARPNTSSARGLLPMRPHRRASISPEDHGLGRQSWDRARWGRRRRLLCRRPCTDPGAYPLPPGDRPAGQSPTRRPGRVHGFAADHALPSRTRRHVNRNARLP